MTKKTLSSILWDCNKITINENSGKYLLGFNPGIHTHTHTPDQAYNLDIIFSRSLLRERQFSNFQVKTDLVQHNI